MMKVSRYPFVLHFHSVNQWTLHSSYAGILFKESNPKYHFSSKKKICFTWHFPIFFPIFLIILVQ